jgi:predicted nucleotidyltransferase
MVAKSDRYGLAWNVIKKFEKEYFGETELLVVVGSLAHGNFNETSDIDMVCVTGHRVRAMTILSKLGLEVSKAELLEYDRFTQGRYFIFNARLDFETFPATCIFLDVDCFRSLADGGTDEYYLFRNAVPEESNLLRDYSGKTLSLPRRKFGVGKYYVSNWYGFINNAGVYSHGSLINKFINKPVVVNASGNYLFHEFRQCLFRLNQRVNELYRLSRSQDQRCHFLNVCIKSNKFSQETIEYLLSTVFVGADEHRPVS